MSTYKNKDIIYIRKKSTFPLDVFAQVEMFPLKGEKTSRNQLNESTGSEKKTPDVLSFYTANIFSYSLIYSQRSGNGDDITVSRPRSE